MLHYLYTADRATYPDERQRVQQGFLIIIHAFSGVRPSSATKTGSKHQKGKSDVNEKPSQDTEELVKLKYKDLEIVLTTDKYGRTRFAVRPTFTHFKGNLKRQQQFIHPSNPFHAVLTFSQQIFYVVRSS